MEILKVLVSDAAGCSGSAPDDGRAIWTPRTIDNLWLYDSLLDNQKLAINCRSPFTAVAFAAWIPDRKFGNLSRCKYT